ncbi:AmmeMemoRadiSam system protein B [Patescibacteria group bacterium]
MFKKNIFLLLFIVFMFSGCKNKADYLKLEPEKESIMIRPPAVAGSFYPADKNDLFSQINSFLKKASKDENGKLSRILIVPHAGLSFSGQTAAWGFKQIENESFSRVVLIGVSHRSYFSYAAVYRSGAWETPLGKVEIDSNFADSLINQSNQIEEKSEVFEQEHSLEVELPFLQYLLSDFKIVPILLGQAESDVLTSLAETLENNIDEQTLIVISSDLSHYPSYEVANKIDKETINAILTGNVNKFSQIINENIKTDGVDTCACGADAIKVGLLLANKLDITDIRMLNYTNSGDSGGDKSKVVGYASIGFFKESKDTKTSLNKSEKNKLLEIARQTLNSYLKNKIIPEVTVTDEILKEKLGAFVTIKKDGSLRGCIGEFEPDKPLYQVVQDKAVDAALHDPRFKPVNLKELPDLNLEVSVMSPKKRVSSYKEIKLGEHGVVIRKGLKGGTYLPQVAVETGWDLESFLKSLCSQKAGLAENCYKDPKTEIYTFTAQVFSEEE